VSFHPTEQTLRFGLDIFLFSFTFGFVFLILFYSCKKKKEFLEKKWTTGVPYISPIFHDGKKKPSIVCFAMRNKPI
jgi:hypothetical protein